MRPVSSFSYWYMMLAVLVVGTAAGEQARRPLLRASHHDHQTPPLQHKNAACSFRCPTHSTPHLLPIVCSLDDCICHAGYIKMANDCVLADTTAPTLHLRSHHHKHTTSDDSTESSTNEEDSTRQANDDDDDDDDAPQQQQQQAERVNETLSSSSSLSVTTHHQQRQQHQDDDVQLERDVETYLHDEEMYGTQDILES